MFRFLLAMAISLPAFAGYTEDFYSGLYKIISERVLKLDAVVTQEGTSEGKPLDKESEINSSKVMKMLESMRKSYRLPEQTDVFACRYTIGPDFIEISKGFALSKTSKRTKYVRFAYEPKGTLFYTSILDRFFSEGNSNRHTDNVQVVIKAIKIKGKNTLNGHRAELLITKADSEVREPLYMDRFNSKIHPNLQIQVSDLGNDVSFKCTDFVFHADGPAI